MHEAEHDMKNYAERGECCRPRLNAEVNKFTRFYYHSCKDQDHLFLRSFFSIFSNAMIDCKLPVDQNVGRGLSFDKMSKN